MTGRGAVPALVVAAAFFGVGVVGSKYALGSFEPVTLLSVELLAATAALWLVVLVRGYRRLGVRWRVLALGLFEPALANLGQDLGLARTSSANGALLTGLESVFVVLLAAVFLRERITAVLATAVTIGLLGLVAIEGSSTFAGPGLGDLLVTGGMLCAAAYTIVAKGLGADVDSITLTAVQFAIATLAVLPLSAVTIGTGHERWPTHVAPRFWVAAVAVGVLGCAVSFLLYNYAIVFVAAGPASVIINLIPAFGLVAAVAWLGDALTVGRIVGASLIGLSVATFTALEFVGARSHCASAEDVAAQPI